eukprot:COSAG01_NODE_5659_length_4114_cov_12.053051_3_plen_137_part_00
MTPLAVRRSHSLFGDSMLPRGMFSPDSSRMAVWDLMQVCMIRIEDSMSGTVGDSQSPAFLVSLICDVWDLMQIVLLIYVAVTVPLRACFDIEVDPGSFAFWFEVLVVSEHDARRTGSPLFARESLNHGGVDDQNRR